MTEAVIIVAENAASLLRIGGRSLAARLAVHCRMLGAAEILIMGSPQPCMALERERAVEGEAWQTGAAATERLAALAAAGRMVLAIKGNMVLDERLLAHALKGGAGTPGVVRVAARDFSAGHLSWATAAAAAVPHFWLQQRRRLQPYAIEVVNAADLARAEAVILNAAGKGHQEWPVILFNRPVETFLSRYVTRLAITPNQITGLSIATGLLAAAVIGLGFIWAGLGLCAATAVLDGLDGRQARVQIRFSKGGELEHVADKIVEAAWVAAFSWYVDRSGAGVWALWGGAAWFALILVANASGSYFRARRGFLPDLATPFDSGLRLIATRRNTNLAYFALALLFNAPIAGFWAIVAASAGFAALHWLRAALLLRQPAAAPWLAGNSAFAESRLADWLFGVPHRSLLTASLNTTGFTS